MNNQELKKLTSLLDDFIEEEDYELVYLKDEKEKEFIYGLINKIRKDIN